MPRVHNLDRVPEKYIDDPDFATRLQTKFLGAVGGSERLYVNIDSVKPGARSAKYHSHSLQEEFFLVLRGQGTLRLDGESISVQQGDFFSKPAGRGIAHQFINDGDEVLQILDCGTRDQDDVITYPEEDVLVVRRTGEVFRKTDKVEGWSSDPND